MSFVPFQPTQRDAIILRSLAISPTIIPSTWSQAPLRSSRQPALIHARVLPHSGFPLSAQLDQLDSDTVSYATLASAFCEHANHPEHVYNRVERLAEDLAKIAIWDCGCDEIDLGLELTNDLLLGASASVLIRRARSDYFNTHTVRPLLRHQLSSRGDRLELKDLRVSCVIGVLDHERVEEQTVVVNILFWLSPPPAASNDNQIKDLQADMTIGIRALTTATVGHIRESSFFTVEALAASLADTLLSIPQPNYDPPSPAIKKVKVRIEKPSAIAFAHGAGVELTRSWPPRFITASARPFKLHSSRAGACSFESNPAHHIVYLGLGSNMGDRLQNISTALDSLCRPLGAAGAQAELLDTSFVYESEPMYVTDQPRFLNAACKISTPLDAFELLKVLKSIEQSAGRDLESKERNGPRPIDLDILLFDSQTIEHQDLRVPHIGIPSRPFVLEPLYEWVLFPFYPSAQLITDSLRSIAPQLVHPLSNLTIATHRAQISTPDSTPSLRRIHALRSPALDLSERTHLMSIINCTPDSFSSNSSTLNSSDFIQEALAQVEAGADILDLGGMSTRPGAEEVDETEEMRRTVPVIEALRSIHGVRCHISIDTMKASVAEAAIRAGATMVNDVSGGRADEAMLSTVARLGVPVVLMHMRGQPQTMSKMTNYGSDVVAGVRSELGEQVRKALSAGVRRWNIIVDPGIGFAKDVDGNCGLLGRLAEFVDETGPLRGFPLLVGPSRKRFVSELMGRPGVGPRDRVFGTAAACAIAVGGGARVLRVHDTSEMKDVVRVLDGIRSRSRLQVC
ncbi:hypothetical protein CROQUDRAFT_91621 [Cronartium quercuum f. sp. fusiforme G11]|uniref:Folic acid synthesis protein FOL1 n=1 Tax=Cronartium quercuum f. sp. fusiforme G11 TaxID=708437 RepID=A0A9P6TE33_9BASI|nr:hypothetical protein CROQUDRAFT_91621 [Cronartium quercuum f. sp. fusiforme G11]